MHHRIALDELYQYAKFRVGRSKFPENKGPHAYAYAYARAYAPAQHVHYAPHHQITCTIEFRLLNSISVPNLVSIAQNFLEPEDPSRINFPGPGARSLHPTRTVIRKKHIGWDSRHVTCTSGISGAHRLSCRGGKRITGIKHLHVHCTCTMHPSPLRHTAPSRPCQGVPMYRVWCP